jgi:3-dehydroquinate synthase
MKHRMEVSLGDRSYPIHIGRDLWGHLKTEVEACRRAGRPAALIYDAALEAHQGAFLEKAFEGLPRLELPSGEPTKSLEHLGRVFDFLADIPLDRTGVLFVCGGGVVGDLGGFAAASFLRGITFHLVPTTLLSMVDSSVGGKTGINLPAGKNLVGAFYQPRSVVIDTAVLHTLPEREFAAGMAEVVKYGMLGNRELLERLEGEAALAPGHPALEAIIETCCRQKAQVVMADEKEQAASGGRALLNLGHTFAHAIEAVAGYGSYLHGEAVAVGLVLATRLSVELGWVVAEDVERVEALLARCNLPVALREPLNGDALYSAMMRDKKVKFGQLRMVAMRELGHAVTVDSVSEDTIRKLWRTAGAED